MKILARSFLILAVGLLNTHCGSLPLDGQKTFDRDAWKDDYAVLKTNIAQLYVNLDDLVRLHNIDLIQMDDVTTGALKNVNSNDEAQHALFKFVEAFHDPSLELMSDNLITRQPVKKAVGPHVKKQLSVETDDPKIWGGSTAGAMEGFAGHQAQIAPEALMVAPNVYAEQACTSMGFKKRGFEFHFPYDVSAKSQEHQYSSDSFPALTLKLANGKKIGMIRIGRFTPKSFFDACVHEWPAYSKKLKKLMPTAKRGGPLPAKGQTANGMCGPECQDLFIEEYVENHLIRDFEAAVNKLKKDHVHAIVIDVTDNNGGTQWETTLPRILTNKAIDCGAYGISRSTATLSNLESQKYMYEGQLQRAQNESKGKKSAWSDQIADLKTKLSDIEVLKGQMQLTCDRAKIFENPNLAAQCPLVLQEKIKSCMTDPVYKYHAGLYSGPLFVLTNRNSGGVAADFAARLKNSQAALIMGERSQGTGCLTRNKGVTTVLPNSGLKLYAPDCARYLTDGTNEIEGIQAQIPLNMPEMGGDAFLPRLRVAVQTALEQMPDAATDHVKNRRAERATKPKALKPDDADREHEVDAAQGGASGKMESANAVSVVPGTEPTTKALVDKAPPGAESTAGENKPAGEKSTASGEKPATEKPTAQ